MLRVRERYCHGERFIRFSRQLARRCCCCTPPESQGSTNVNRMVNLVFYTDVCCKQS